MVCKLRRLSNISHEIHCKAQPLHSNQIQMKKKIIIEIISNNDSSALYIEIVIINGKKSSLPMVGLEPGPIWWQAVTLTIMLTG